MSPEDASAMDLFLREPRTVREIAIEFKISKVTAGLWVKGFPTEVGSKRQGKAGPFSKTYKINRSKGSK